MELSGVLLDIYARVSRLDDKRMRSTDGQVADCTQRVLDVGARVGEVFVDPGRSAWNPKVRRPAWDKLMHRLESRISDGAIFFDLARFSRKPIEGERLIMAAESGLVILDSEDEYDLTSASGKKAFRDQIATAAYESDRGSTRSRRGKRLKALNGEPNISQRPFGLELDGRTIREEEAAIIRDLAERFLAGESQDAMVIELNAAGIATSTGGSWSRTSLKQVLMRPCNAGHVTYRGEVVAKMPGPTILEEDQWERVCAVYASRRRGRPISDAYLCSGILRCGRCGHALSGRPRINMAPYPDGAVRRQYWCQPRSHKGGCGRIAVDQRELDRYVKAMTVRLLADPRHVAAVESLSKEIADRRQPVEAEIAECEHLAEELAGRLGRGEITLARHDAAVGPLDARLVVLRGKLAEVEALADSLPSEATAGSLAEWADRWDEATVSERRGLLRQALRGRRIVVMPADLSAPRKFDPRRIVISEG